MLNKCIAVDYGGRGHIRGRLCAQFKGFEVVFQVLEVKRENSSVSSPGTPSQTLQLQQDL